MALHVSTRPEPMNASPHHSKVRTSLTLSDPLYVAGGAITGKMEMECRADKGLGLGVIMVELFAIEELTSRDHSATSTFLHTRRIYQGPGLPPSNAVLPHPIAGEPPFPAHYHQARRGLTTFLFRLPIPSACPSSIDFGSGLARIKYEVRATIGVSWKGENRLVTDKKEVDIVEKYDEDFDRIEPEGVIVGEHGKIWVQAKVVGGLLVSGESACVELQVKNHSSKKSTGLAVTLTRHLHLPSASTSHKPPLQISDTLTTVNFRGPEYIAHPGTEGLAQLVFDVPRTARTVGAGDRPSDEEETRMKEALFAVRCTVSIKMAMPIGSKDILLDLPVTIFHPATLPPLPDSTLLPNPYDSPPYALPMSPPMAASVSPLPFDRVRSPYAYPITPPPQLYYDQGQVWFPPPSQSPFSMPYLSSPPPVNQHYYYPQHHLVTPHAAVPRPSSAVPVPSQLLYNLPSGLPPSVGQHPLLPLASVASEVHSPADPEEGKGERASRITQHLRLTSRNRSVSPQSHRYPVASPRLPFVPEPTEQTPPPQPRSQMHISLANISPSLSHAQTPLVSPRPMPSPTLTHTRDPFTRMSLTKSERVQELERMAAEVEKENADLSGELNLGSGLNVDKTLPGPPVPSGKDRLTALNRPRVDSLFRPEDAQAPAYSGPAPKTPTLSALSLLKPPRSALKTQDHEENGLDALERRLLAEVGTRKHEDESHRPDVRTVMPITIPRGNAQGEDAVNESAISSLSLGADLEQDYEAARARGAGEGRAPAVGGDDDTGLGLREPEFEQDHELVDRISDERTQKQGRGRGSNSHSGESERGTRRGKAHSIASGKDKNKEKSSRKKAKDGRDEEAVKLRKAAKGRVAEWLGKIEVSVPPADEPSPVHSPRASSPVASSPDSASPVLSTMHLASDDKPVRSRSNSAQDASTSNPAQPPPVDEYRPIDTAAPPNPRSSGFVPIATLRDRKAAQQGAKVLQSTPTSDPRKDSVPRANGILASLPLSPRARLEAALKSAPPVIKPVPKKLAVAGQPHLPIFSPLPTNSPAKYDVRSARGGRGGKVTSVAAIWASGTPTKLATATPPTGKPVTDAPAPNPAKPKAFLAMPKLRAAAAPMPHAKTPLSTPSPLSAGKATSSPATVSSSLAIPMLSSTASLSRPTQAQQPRPATRLPTVVETQVAGAGKPGPPPKTAATELAFGQARLRDLIRKYQGQTA